VRSEFTPAVERQLKEAGLSGIVESVPDFNFSWSPSGRAIYCALTFRGAVNLWKMTVDPATLRITHAERLTTGPGPDGEIGLSADGRKLAFTAQTQRIWAWLFPLDANRGQLKGLGKAASPDAITVWRLSLSPDGKKLAFAGNRSGWSSVWERSLLGSYNFPVVPDERPRDRPRWSHDGEHILYLLVNPTANTAKLMDWSAASRHEEFVAEAEGMWGGFDWAPDDKSIVLCEINVATHRSEIWLLPMSGSPGTTPLGRRAIFEPNYDLYQPSVSPDGRWVAFQAVKDLRSKLEANLYVAAIDGGSWIRITDAKHWDDKPRWSPDGKVIYFISGRSGFFNVWAIRFDPSKGKVIGDPFAVTNFDSPSRMMPEHEPSVDLSITQDQMLLTLEQLSGGIWVLDDLEH
jgi:Tol biopolymer transport system component